VAALNPASGAPMKAKPMSPQEHYFFQWPGPHSRKQFFADSCGADCIFGFIANYLDVAVVLADFQGAPLRYGKSFGCPRRILRPPSAPMAGALSFFITSGHS
jgi:hypothetical protein